MSILSNFFHLPITPQPLDPAGERLTAADLEGEHFSLMYTDLLSTDAEEGEEENEIHYFPAPGNALYFTADAIEGLERRGDWRSNQGNVEREFAFAFGFRDEEVITLNNPFTRQIIKARLSDQYTIPYNGRDIQVTVYEQQTPQEKCRLDILNSLFHYHARSFLSNGLSRIVPLRFMPATLATRVSLFTVDILGNYNFARCVHRVAVAAAIYMEYIALALLINQFTAISALVLSVFLMGKILLDSDQSRIPEAAGIRHRVAISLIATSLEVSALALFAKVAPAISNVVCPLELICQTSWAVINYRA